MGKKPCHFFSCKLEQTCQKPSAVDGGLCCQDEYLRSPQGKKELKSLKRKANQEVDPQLMGTTAVWKPSRAGLLRKFLVV